jgi:hypothetical protein
MRLVYINYSISLSHEYISQVKNDALSFARTTLLVKKIVRQTAAIEISLYLPSLKCI